MMHEAWSSIEEVSYCLPRLSVNFQGHTQGNINDFQPNWAFPGGNSSLNSFMATKWGTNLDVPNQRCPIAFQGHIANFKVARDNKSPILTRIGRFQTVTPVWIQQGLWNDAQSLTQHRRGALLFCEVIHHFSNYTGQNIDDLGWVRLVGWSQFSVLPFYAKYVIHACNINVEC